MTTNLEVLFCDLCNESVPQTDVESGKALRVKGRVIGGCCIAALRPAAPERIPERIAERRSGGAASTIVGVLVIAGLAAGVAFLDWRLAEDVGHLSRSLESIAEQQRGTQQRVASLEEAVAQLAERSKPDVITARLDAVDSRIDNARNSAELRASRLEEAQQTVSENARLVQAEQRDAMAALRTMLQGVASEVAALRATPNVAPKAPETVSEPHKAAPAAASTEPDLPPELKHQILALTDEDPGTRFAAVDKLLRSNDLRVLPGLLPMAKDANPFVRRLTVEGLRTFRRPESVETLLVALADPEPIVRLTANASLRALTGQRFDFDDASPSTRAVAQRRWQDWWEKNRASFAF